MSQEQASPSPHDFYARELTNALEEQRFGIAGYRIHPSSGTEACASVDLLEDSAIVVALTARGYRVLKADEEEEEGRVEFEFVDELLRSVSPIYQAKSHELLVQKLLQISPRSS